MAGALEVQEYSISEGLVCLESDPGAHNPGPVDQLEHRSLEARGGLPRSGDNCVAEGGTSMTPVMTRSPFSL